MKFTAVILSAVMLVTGLFFVPAKSEAAGDNYILHQSGQATENQEIVSQKNPKKQASASCSRLF